MNKLNNKAFTLIELIVVIAILGVLVLLAAPRFLGYTEDAKLAQIKNDVKAYETVISQELLDNDNFFDGLELANNENLIKYAEEGKLFNKRGLVDSKVIIGSHFEINKSKLKVDSKLKGQFFTNEKGLVFYYEENFESPKDESSNDVDLDKNEDFQWVIYSRGYTATGQNEKGYYKYIGKQSEIEIPHVINGHPMTSYYRMFENSRENIKKVISTNKNITDMNNMFYESRATTLDLSNFDTSSVENMSYMFHRSKATTLDLSSFNTINVTDMGGMFSTTQATTLDLSKFNTSKVKNMSYMFSGAKATTLDLSSFNTINVTDMGGMFSTTQATTLDLSKFNTSKVKNMSYMFQNSKATTLDLSNFDTSSVTDMNNMFYNSKALTLNLSNFDTRSVSNMSYMFTGFKATTLDVSKFDTNNVNDMSFMFSGTQATTLNVSKFDTSKVKSMRSMFAATEATTLDLSSFDTSKVNDMNNMFYNSKATTGYARTNEDINRLNSSSSKPANLVFKLK